MEHEIEKAIREKMLLAEQTAVAWDKESVWLKTSQNIGVRSGSNVWYYAAASLLLAVVVFIVSESAKRKQFDQQIKSLELAIEKSQYEVPVTIASPDLVEECPESQITSHQKKIRAVNRDIEMRDVSKITNPIVNSEISERVTVTEEIPAVASDVPQIEATEPVAQPVHAIFGMEAPRFTVSAPRKIKKLRVRLFKVDEENGFMDNTNEPINVLAKINKK